MQTESILVTGGADSSARTSSCIGSPPNRLRWSISTSSPTPEIPRISRNLRVMSRYKFIQGDICDRKLVFDLLQQYQPRAIVHFAAESHVDRSIHGPDDFVRTNVNGTFSLLEEARAYWANLPANRNPHSDFCMFQPTKCMGRLDPMTRASTRTLHTPRTARIPRPRRVLIISFVPITTPTGCPHSPQNCSNNYGPYQFPEKLIPLAILHALKGKPIPVYGDGKNVRDWLYVEDHCEAIRTVIGKGRVGETYNIGGNNEKQNLEIVRTICKILDDLRPNDPTVPHEKLLTYVQDRPGHDRRYAIDARKLESELGWRPKETFETGIRKTIEWYLANEAWTRDVTSGSYRQWMAKQYSV